MPGLARYGEDEGGVQPSNERPPPILGVVVNPFSGAGGRLGWKGTDWPLPLRVVEERVPLVAPARAREFMTHLSRRKPGLIVYAPGGPMGWGSLGEYRGDARLLDCVDPGKWPTTPEDTARCARLAVDRGVGLLVFVGGDGTARIMLESVDEKVPVLGVPAGVKVYSGVFAYTPREAAEIVALFMEGRARLVERMVLDVDEEAFRRGELVVRPYGYLRVPMAPGLVASGKSASHGPGEEAEIEEIAEYFADELYEDCTLYILGPGRTVSSIAEKLGIGGKTRLGVDVAHNRSLIARDVDEETLYKIVSSYPGRKVIVVSPIGGQGFLFGRGNQQISPRVIRLVGRDNIIVVSSPSKLSRLRVLRVDTGDPLVDEMLRGYIRVLTGYGRYRMVRVE